MARGDDTMDHRSASLAETVARAEARRREVLDGLRRYRADLPLRYWRQVAHYTTPAADAATARKAVEGGTAPMGRILERFGVTSRDLAARLEVDPERVNRLLAHPQRAPLVMLDGEDALADRADVVAAAMDHAATVLREADWAGDGPPTLRFYRPPGFRLESAIRDLHLLLWRLAATTGGEGSSDPNAFPLDGIVVPKLEHPEEVDLLFEILDAAERELGLPANRIRVGLLVESGWAATQLAEIARRAAPRLCALIFGLADYSADLGLPRIQTDHPLAEWARAEIVAVAGGVGVPAIDGMTLDYPVADPALDAKANRERFLDRMALVYRDAVRARELGMAGKWVGHPAQLFAVLLAFETGLEPAALEAEAAKLEAYRRAVEHEARGATIIGGVMSDRATDRHARMVLRRATALGRFDPERSLRLGVIDPAELEEARAAWRAQGGDG